MVSFRVRAKVWKWDGAGPWHFVYIGKKNSERIKKKEGIKKIGFGFVPVLVKIGKTTWRTTLFPTKEREYLLSIKASVRKSEGIMDGDIISISIKLG